MIKEKNQQIFEEIMLEQQKYEMLSTQIMAQDFEDNDAESQTIIEEE